MTRKTDIKYEGRRGKTFIAKITLEDGTKFSFEARYDIDEYGSDWDITFEGRAGLVKPTDAGIETTTALQLFAALGVVFKEFVKREKPAKFSFSAGDKSRIKLYDTASKRIARQLKYKVIRKDQTYKDFSGVVWEFTK